LKIKIAEFPVTYHENTHSSVVKCANFKEISVECIDLTGLLDAPLHSKFHYLRVCLFIISENVKKAAQGKQHLQQRYADFLPFNSVERYNGEEDKTTKCNDFHYPSCDLQLFHLLLSYLIAFIRRATFKIIPHINYQIASKNV